jgi:hypothetical protein
MSSQRASNAASLKFPPDTIDRLRGRVRTPSVLSVCPDIPSLHVVMSVWCVRRKKSAWFDLWAVHALSYHTAMAHVHDFPSIPIISQLLPHVIHDYRRVGRLFCPFCCFLFFHLKVGTAALPLLSCWGFFHVTPSETVVNATMYEQTGTMPLV